ncbi:MAG: glycerophosphodiester phosphodiesterase [Bacteroidota bacterium]
MSDPEATTPYRSDTLRTPAGLDVQGHRGARGRRPENTWPAFQYALEQGLPTLEMDVVISADGQVVVSHEPWMNADICTAPNGAPLPNDEAQQHNLYRMTYDEIAAYDCGQRQHPSFPEQQPEPAAKPLLRDVIAQAEAFVRATEREPVFYNIETKSRPAWEGRFHPPPDAFAQHLIDVIAATGVSPRTTVQSFDPRTLRYTREAAPELRLALLIAQESDQGVSENLEALGFVPHIYSPDAALVDAALVQTAHAQGMQVIPWTVNDLETMRGLVEIGVDGLITDYPDRGMRVRAE